MQDRCLFQNCESQTVNVFSLGNLQKRNVTFLLAIQACKNLLHTDLYISLSGHVAWWLAIRQSAVRSIMHARSVIQLFSQISFRSVFATAYEV